MNVGGAQSTAVPRLQIGAKLGCFTSWGNLDLDKQKMNVQNVFWFGFFAFWGMDAEFDEHVFKRLTDSSPGTEGYELWHWKTITQLYLHLYMGNLLIYLFISISVFFFGRCVLNNPLHCICIISVFSHRMNKKKGRTGNRSLRYPMIFVKSWFKVCTEGLLSRIYNWDLQIVDTFSTSTLLKQLCSRMKKRCFFFCWLVFVPNTKKRKVRKARKCCVRPLSANRTKDGEFSSVGNAHNGWGEATPICQDILCKIWLLSQQLVNTKMILNHSRKAVGDFMLPSFRMFSGECGSKL